MNTRLRTELLLLLVAGVAVLSMVLPVGWMADDAAAQATTPTIELAYDDGKAFETLAGSPYICVTCMAYQGVRFDLGGATVMSITAVRFYAGGRQSQVRVHLTDAVDQQALIDYITVSVSAAQWYTVTIPETRVTRDFFVWIQISDKDVMPYRDVIADHNRSFVAEHPQLKHAGGSHVGDLMIRAVVKAEIHVGEGQDYATIQEAVDAAGEGLQIIVHEGTYTENVVVDKKLTIVSKDGPSNTIVSAEDPSASAFTVASKGMTVSGFTIQGASGVGAAGVHLNGSADCSVAGNRISNNYYGLLVSAASTGSTVIHNDVGSNVYGVWVDGQRTNIAGNSFEGNTAPNGSAVYLSSSSGENEVHFNDFIESPATDQVLQVYNDSSLQVANCANNWWGNASGPRHASANPSGTGAAVGDGVRFHPWLALQPSAVKTGTAMPGAYWLSARAGTSATVVMSGTGTPTVWVAIYPGNPGGEFPGASLGKWIDVYFNSTSGVSEVEIRVYYTQDEIVGLKEGSLRLYWWSGTEWKVCSRSGVNGTEDFVWGRVLPTTTPGMANLAGTPFGVGATSGGFALWWIVAGVVVVVVALAVLLFALRVLQQRSSYYE
jgi:parallel beta-helix repeat protein